MSEHDLSPGDIVTILDDAILFELTGAFHMPVADHAHAIYLCDEKSSYIAERFCIILTLVGVKVTHRCNIEK